MMFERMSAKERASGSAGTVARRALVTALMACVPAAASQAQTLTTGVIVGVVVDETDLPLNGVSITVINRANGQRSVSRTDRAGTYSSDLLSPGHYDALYERLGYEPLRVEDILVSASQRRNVRAALRRPSGTVSTRRVIPADATLTLSGQSGPDRWLLAGTGAASMPFDGTGLSALGRISSITGEQGEIEGLPAHFGGVVVDGIPLARRANDFGTFVRNAAVPLAYLSQVALTTTDLDVEYPGQSGGRMTAFTRRGGRERGAEAFGDYGNQSLVSGDAEPPSFSAYRAGLLAEGGIVTDTASFILGGEVLRSRTPYTTLWSNDAETLALAQAADRSYGIDFNDYIEPALSTFDRETAFGRLDFRISEGTSVSLRGLFGQIKEPMPIAPWTGSPIASTLTPRYREIIGSAALVTRVDDNLLAELNAGFESSRATERAPADRGPLTGVTSIVSAGRQIGTSEQADGFTELTAFHLRGTVHIRSGTHWRKLGLSASLPSYRMPMTVGRAGEFTFANVDDFGNGFGSYRGVEGNPARAEFELRRVSVIAQDVWRPRPGFELQAGARVSSFRLPDSQKISLDAGWQRLTGLVNNAIPGRTIEFEPRFGIRVTPPSAPDWHFSAGLSIDADAVLPSSIAEVFSNAGVLRVRSGSGSLGPWPGVPAGTTAPLRGATLTVIGPKFRGPQTARVFGSLTRSFGALGAITTAATYRRTQFLPQRVDLNLSPAVTGHDQFGRPLFGSLVKQGETLRAAVESNRRFGSYEEVWGLQSTAESTYTGITVSIERPLLGGVAIFGSYTWSKTDDDWMRGNPVDPFTQIVPFPDTLNTERWVDGRSDLDVPHRLVTGAELVLPLGFEPRLAALFRYQSGYPFTPGFRSGVDANADGSGRNDPAFIDEAVSGISSVLGAWPCLQQDVGRFAARNACRGPGIMSLDARFTLGLMRGDYRVALVVDGLNLIASDAGAVDEALYLVDPDQPLQVSADGAITTIPLIANPDFGALVTRYTPQRQLRLGLRVSF